MFVLSLVVSEAYLPPVMNLIVKNRFYGFLLAGVIPILIMWAIAKILDWLNIKLKF